MKEFTCIHGHHESECLRGGMCAHPGCRAEAELVDARPAPELAPLVRLPLREILDWFMCSDPWPADEKAHEIIESWLQEKCKRRGYKDWVEAYHNENISVDAQGNPRRVASALAGQPAERVYSAAEMREAQCLAYSTGYMSKYGDPANAEERDRIQAEVRRDAEARYMRPDVGEEVESSPVDSVRESSIPDASGEPGPGKEEE